MKTRSKALLVSTIWATVYTIVAICVFVYSITWLLSTEDGDWVELLPAFMAVLITPYMIPMALGVVFGWIGFLRRSLRATWVAITFYSVSVVWLFFFFWLWGAPMPFFVMIVITSPVLILSFIGYAKQKKINKKLAAENEN